MINYNLILNLVIIFFYTLGWSQYKVEGLNIVEKENQKVIYFVNQNSEGFYLPDGKFIKSYGRIKFSQVEFNQFREDLKKISKKESGSLKRSNYELNTFEFNDNEVYFSVKEKIGSITKKQIKEILNL